MIRAQFPTSGLTPSITIKTLAGATSASGTMTEVGVMSNGAYLYEYAFSGTAGTEYRVQMDGGASITNPLLRYYDITASEESAGGTVDNAAIATAVRLELATELARIDANISSRMATFTYTAPNNSDISAIKSKTDQMVFTTNNLHVVAKVVEDKTGYALTPAQITAIATAVEGALINESDGQTILNAIVSAIGNTNVNEVALVAAIRADIERTGGMLDLVPTNPVLATDTRLDHLDADVSSRAVPGDVSIQLTSAPNAQQPIILQLS